MKIAFRYFHTNKNLQIPYTYQKIAYICSMKLTPIQIRTLSKTISGSNCQENPDPDPTAKQSWIWILEKNTDLNLRKKHGSGVDIRKFNPMNLDTLLSFGKGDTSEYPSLTEPFIIFIYAFLNRTINIGPDKCNTAKPLLDYMTLNLLQMHIVKSINCLIVVLKFDYDLCDY